MSVLVLTTDLLLQSQLAGAAQRGPAVQNGQLG